MMKSLKQEQTSFVAKMKLVSKKLKGVHGCMMPCQNHLVRAFSYTFHLQIMKT